MDPKWKIDPTKSWKAPENTYVRDANLPWCLCSLAEQQGNVTHYVGIAGVGHDAPLLPVGDPRIGFFGFDRLITFRDIADGSSNTIVIVETLRDVGPWIAGGYTTTRGLERPPYLGEDLDFDTAHRSSGFWSGWETNAAFLDGSARSFSENQAINPKTWKALVTIAGGEEFEIPE